MATSTNVARSQYQQRVDAVKGKNLWQLLGLPLIVSLVVLAVLPSVGLLLMNVLPKIGNESINLPSGIGMWVGLIGGALLMIWASKLTWSALGFVRPRWGSSIAMGALLGFGLLTIVALVIWMCGGITIGYAFAPEAWGPILVAAFFFLAQGTWEELVYRGYLMPQLSKLWEGKAWGDALSIILTSVMFTLFHAFNPGLTFMPILNLTIYGFVFAMLYYRTGSMWITGMAHVVWNFSQGYIFGSEVSGNPPAASILRSAAVPGHDLLSGGTFGFEGSIITSLAGLAIIVFLALGWPRLVGKRK